MNLVKGLVELIHSNKLYIPELRESILHHPKLSVLYEGFISGRFKDDEDAAQQIYNSTKRHSAYLKLKNNLRRRLVDAVFFIDTVKENYSDRQKAYFECYKEWAAAKIILSRNTQPAAMMMLEQILKKAEIFEFTDLVTDIVRALRIHYGTREGILEKYHYYNDLYHKYWKIVSSEDRAEELYAFLMVNYVQNKSLKSSIQENAMLFYEELQPAVEELGTYRLLLYSGLIRLITYSSVNDYEQILKVCDDMLTQFSKKPYTPGVPIQIFNYQQLVCFIQLKDFNRGRDALPRFLALVEQGSFNWFKYHELYLQLAFHTANYQDAYTILPKVFKEKSYHLLPASTKEIWNLNLAYAVFLQREEKISLPQDDTLFKNFRLGKFLNTIPILSKDKRGMNVSILILHMLFLLQEQKYDDVIDRIEAVQKYCSRYLKHNELFRSNCFINMLLEIPIQNFHPVAVKRHTDKYLQKLTQAPLEVTQQTVEIEIIPYEDLWKIIITHLENSESKKD